VETEPKVSLPAPAADYARLRTIPKQTLNHTHHDRYPSVLRIPDSAATKSRWLPVSREGTRMGIVFSLYTPSLRFTTTAHGNP